MLVAGMPLVPTLVGCTVWQQVQCTWTPSTQEQTNYTGIQPRQQIIRWSRGYDAAFSLASLFFPFEMLLCCNWQSRVWVAKHFFAFVVNSRRFSTVVGEMYLELILSLCG